MADSKPVEVTCNRCNCHSTEFERLSGGHWYFWCCHCKDHIVIPTVQYLEMRIANGAWGWIDDQDGNRYWIAEENSR
jgi:hypothetical protein